MARIRYIGSKSRIAAHVLEVIGAPGRGAGAFVDVFSGTGAVSREAALRGWSIRANDYLLSSAAMTAAQVAAAEHVPYRAFGGYHSAIAELNQAKASDGFIFREYTSSGASASGHTRQYFTCENGRKIDGIRQKIAEWECAGLLNRLEALLLIADLLSAANTVANIAGTYGCFLSYWSQNALRPLALAPRQLLPVQRQVQIECIDAFAMHFSPTDTVYLDPPYTKRQYAAYYHILETIAAGDAPVVDGVTGLRPWRDKSSPFCFKRKALDALDRLIQQIPSERIYLSYSSEGHMELPDLWERLRQYGKVAVFEVAQIGRYRPNVAASIAASSVREYVVELVKQQASEEAAD